MDPPAPAADDPQPQPPREPLPEECCGGGCEPCVFDRYSVALERYQEALRAWQERHPVTGTLDGQVLGAD